jgi:hypothetical protein
MKLRENLEALLPEPAVNWLMTMFDVIQTLDDFADGEQVERKDLDALIWNTLVALPGNAFFMQHAGMLLPVIAMAILKWQASDQAEREGRADERAYMWRAGYYDLVLMAVLLTHGSLKTTEISEKIMRLYGEEFKDYIKEFHNA